PLQSFGGGARWDFAYVVTARAPLQLRGSMRLDLGLNYARGKTSQRATSGCLLPTTVEGVCATAFDNWYDNIYGADVFFSWVSPSGYRGVAWTTEWFMRQIPDLKILNVAHAQLEGGLYSQVVVQAARHWFIGFRGEATGVPRGDNLRTELAAE